MVAAAQAHTALDRIEGALRSHSKKTNGKGMWQCPAHEDTNPSLSIKYERGKVLLKCFAGCESKTIVESIGLDLADLFDHPVTPKLVRPRLESSSCPNKPTQVAEYVYTDRDGEVLSTKTRTEPGHNGRSKSFKWSNGNPHALYNLRGVIEADHVHINEGEKAADALNNILPSGHAATCAPTPKWEPEFTDQLMGKTVTVWADRDESGLKQALPVHQHLDAAGVTVEIVQPATLNEKSDAFDHIEAGFGVEKAVRLDPANFRCAEDVYETEDEAMDERFRFLGLEQIEYRTHSRSLIKGFIDRGSFVVMYGDSNSSKTFLGVDIGLCVASGRKWHGRKTTKGLVVYVAAEGGRGITNRIRAYLDHYLKGECDIPFFVLPVPVNLLDDEGDVGPLIAAIRRLEERTGKSCELVEIDTLAESMPGGDESGSKDMGAAVAAVQQIRRELVCSVILIHHCGKDAGRGARGWSGLRAATDTEVEVSNLGELYFHAKPTKQRDYAMGEPFPYRLNVVEIGEDEDGDIVTTCVVVPVDRGVIPDQKPKGKLNDRCRIFEGCMEGLIKSRGRSIPDEVAETHSGEVSSGQWGVLLKDVRPLFYERIKDRDDDRDSSRDTSGNYRKYFNRTKEKLLALERIDVSGEWVWFR